MAFLTAVPCRLPMVSGNDRKRYDYFLSGGSPSQALGRYGDAFELLSMPRKINPRAAEVYFYRWNLYQADKARLLAQLLAHAITFSFIQSYLSRADGAILCCQPAVRQGYRSFMKASSLRITTIPMRSICCCAFISSRKNIPQMLKTLEPLGDRGREREVHA